MHPADGLGASRGAGAQHVFLQQQSVGHAHPAQIEQDAGADHAAAYDYHVSRRFHGFLVSMPGISTVMTIQASLKHENTTPLPALVIIRTLAIFSFRACLLTAKFRESRL
jgi:hypothetical protein